MINPYLHDCVALLYIFIALSLIYHYKQQPVKMGCIWLTAQIHFIDMWNNMNRSRQADFNTIILVCFFLSSTRSVFSKKKTLYWWPPFSLLSHYSPPSLHFLYWFRKPNWNMKSWYYIFTSHRHTANYRQ